MLNIYVRKVLREFRGSKESENVFLFLFELAQLFAPVFTSLEFHFSFENSTRVEKKIQCQTVQGICETKFQFLWCRDERARVHEQSSERFLCSLQSSEIEI